MSSKALTILIALSAIVAIAVVIAINFRRQRPWIDLSEKEKRERILFFVFTAIISILGITLYIVL